MPLKLLPLPRSEWMTHLRVCDEAFRPGIMSILYPNGFSEEAREHSLQWAIRRADAYPDRSHYFKVIDTDLPADDPFSGVVGTAHWIIHAHDRSEEEMKQEEAWSEKDKEKFGKPPGLNEAARDAFGAAVGRVQKKHIGGKAHVELQVLCTRPQHHKRGIGAMHLGWGAAKADELGLPTFLEGSPMGQALYRRCGFEDVEWMSDVNMMDHGYHDELPHVLMRRPAKIIKPEDSNI